MSRELNIRILNIPAITESGVYDAVFEVNGEMIMREFEVGVIWEYKHDDETNYSHLEHVVVTAICRNEDDEALTDIMERKLGEAIENHIE